MLSKKERIPKHTFQEFKRPQSIFSSKHLTVRVFSGAELKSSKFAVSVSKKVEKRAVLRNKIRRLAYATIKKSGKLFTRPFFVHFIFSSKPVDLKNEISPEIKNLLEKISKIQ